ncbi:unnamed protein product [Acanthoscelides obtectus]|uniref:Uncharacterized protein n=1 Tax=Acanthoscelides obtectus TaxID=200917 RepID=A0A9P0M6M6_ACAOB|nr:unnamed protein product [Acanthoscelides obtectus]CAK1675490.1 hypothetical protein AOBTE_LOCUS30255 [Acanthoscelides obtectus]
MEYERQKPANNSEIPERKKPKTNKRTLDKIARVKGEPFFNNKEIAKQARVTGPDCRCARSKWFEKITEDKRNTTLTKFNMLESKDAQDSHLAVRGHSFLSNGRDFSIIEKHKKTATVEVRSEWDKIIKEAREKPSPYEFVNVNSNMIFDLSSNISQYFLKNPKPPVKNSKNA